MRFQCVFNANSTRTNRWAVVYNVMITLAPLFVIGSSSFLKVTRTTIKSRMGSKLDKIRPRTAELVIPERLENPHRPFMGEMF